METIVQAKRVLEILKKMTNPRDWQWKGISDYIIELYKI